MYEQIKLKISDNQKDKIQRAVKSNEPVTIKIDPNEVGEDILALTKTQINKLSKRKPINIKLSKNQLKHNLKIEGGFLGLLASRVLPVLAKTVLPALGVGALSGLASAGAQKALGEGLYLKKGGCVCQIETDGKGLYLGTVKGGELSTFGDGLYLKRGGEVFEGNGLLLGKNSPFKNIPILGALL